MANFNEKTLPADPLVLFKAWLRAAHASKRIEDATAMCLSTVGAGGYPEGRMLLLKGFSAAGFVFYTNFHSPKGKALLAHPRAALTFYWEALSRQVRIVGPVATVSSTEADLYFKSRPRLSQIGAWASRQSAILKSRAELEESLRHYRKKFQGREVPRPPHWSGFRLKALRIEFWQSRPNRLHDRFLYQRRGSAWKISRLSP